MEAGAVIIVLGVLTTALAYVVHSSQDMSLRLPGGHAFSKKHSHPPRACSVQGSFCVRVSLQTDASAAGEAEPSSKADAAEVIQSLERSCDTSVKENRLHTCLVASLLRNPDLSKSQRTG